MSLCFAAWHLEQRGGRATKELNMESDISVLLGDDVLHSVYLPFSANTLSRHFAPVSSPGTAEVTCATTARVPSGIRSSQLKCRI
jgi:hypothetical protein